MTTGFQPYVIQLAPPSKYLLINFAIPSKFNLILDKTRRSRYSKNAVLRPELCKGLGSSVNSFWAASSCKQLAKKLVQEGYKPIAGGGIHNNFYQLYVIYMDNEGSKNIYVGQTKYPKELRFEQHKIGYHNAKVFGKHHKPFSLAEPLIRGTNTYEIESDAIEAEEQLAERLKKEHYEVYCNGRWL